MIESTFEKEVISEITRKRLVTIKSNTGFIHQFTVELTDRDVIAFKEYWLKIKGDVKMTFEDIHGTFHLFNAQHVFSLSIGISYASEVTS